MKYKLLLITLLLCGIGWGQGTLGIPIFSENFGNIPNNTSLTNTNTSFSYTRIGTSTTSNSYSNKIVAVNPTSINNDGGSSCIIGAKGTSLTTIDKTGLTSFNKGCFLFSFKTPSSLTSAVMLSAVGDGASFASANGFTGSQLSASFQINGTNLQIRSSNSWITVQTISPSTTYKVALVFNNSNSSLNYGNSFVLPSNKVDIWINDIFVNQFNSATSNLSATSFRIYVTTSEFILDDINVYNTLPVISSTTYTTSWSNGTGPTTSLDAVIASNLTTTSDLACKDLTINSGTTLTIGAGKKLTVAGNLINNGSIVFKSDATGTGVFGQFTGTITGSGSVTAERYIPSRRA